MSAAHVLERLKGSGVRISRRGESLWLEPAVAITPDLASELRLHKAALLTMVDELARAFGEYADRNGFSTEDRDLDIQPMRKDPVGWVTYLRQELKQPPLL